MNLKIKKPNIKNLQLNKRFTILKNKLLSAKNIFGIVVALVIILTILLNVGVSALQNKVNLSFDLTKNKVFKITNESINYIKSLNDNIEIDVLSNEDDFTSKGDYFIQANEVLKQYAKYSNKIELKYINLKENPNFAASYPDESIEEDSILIKSGNNHSVLSSNDLFNVDYSYYGTQILSSQAEQTMTSAIMNVTSDKKVKISFIEGFDEEDSSGFVSLLKKNNYDILSQSILTEQIDNESEMVVIYGSKRDFDDDAIEKLNNYMINSGNYNKNVIYIAAPNQAQTPKLNEFLQGFGIKIGDGLVFETDSKKLWSLNSPFYAVNEYVDDEYMEGIKNSKIPVSLPFSKPIEITNTDNVKTLLQFSKTSGVIPSDADETWTVDKNNVTGPIPSVVIATKTSPEDSLKSSNLIVASSVVGFDSTILSKSSLNNSAYFLNVFNTLTKQENSINIESKTIGELELGVNNNQIMILGAIFVIVVPLAVLISGIVIWVKRKNL